MKAKIFVVLSVAIIIVIGVLILQASGSLPFLDQWLNHLNPFKSPLTTITIGDAIITDIQRVSQLTTTIYTTQQVVERGGQAFLASWHMTMVIKGTVEAGLNLNQIDASYVMVSDDGKNITVNLPPVMILTERDRILSSDPDQTYVFETTFTLWGDQSIAITEEDRVRRESGDLILAAACENNILTDATENARVIIEKLLKTTQPNVNITVVSAPVPSKEDCKGK
jgi:hypothetical protein